jgi:Restriction endonuclease
MPARRRRQLPPSRTASQVEPRQATATWSISWSGWEFQVYIAALIERKWGRKVELGPRGADDGVDVRAERPGEFGLELMVVQCKHPRPGKPVGIDTIRLLHLQVITQKATRGLVVTDSRFTRNALQEIQASRYRMEGADGERIRQSLEALRTGAAGAG